MELTSAHAAALWSGLHIILLLVLSVMVVRQRRKHRVTTGDGGVPELLRAIRAFGNAAEYVPIGIAALAVLAVVGAYAPLVHLTGVVLFAGRVAHAVGLSRTVSTSLGRTIGMSLTWVAFLFAAAALIFYGIA